MATAVDVLRRTKEGLLTGYCKDEYEQDLGQAVERGLTVIPGDHPCGTVRCLLGWLRVSADFPADQLRPTTYTREYLDALEALDLLAPEVDLPGPSPSDSRAEAYAESKSTTVEDLCHLIDRVIDSLTPPVDLPTFPCARDLEIV